MKFTRKTVSESCRQLFVIIRKIKIQVFSYRTFIIAGIKIFSKKGKRKMNTNDYLSIVTMEECAELQQALSKALRFGFDDHHPEMPEQSNEQQVLEEYYQLVSMMEELQKRKIIHSLSEQEVQQIKEGKIKKVYQYMEYSIKRNRLRAE